MAELLLHTVLVAVVHLFLMGSMKGKLEFFFFCEVFDDTTIVSLNSKQFHSFIMEWVLTSQHNSVVFKNVTAKLAQGNSSVRRI